MIEDSPFISSLIPTFPTELLDHDRNRKKPRVAIVGADHTIPMVSAKEAVFKNIMTPILIGRVETIDSIAKELRWDISDYEVINADSEQESAKIGAKLCGTKSADILMKGQVHTDLFIKAILGKDAQLLTGKRLVHIFHITHPKGSKPLLISDAAVNVSPDTQTRKDAAYHVVNLLKVLGNKNPRIAFLSATESLIESVPSSIEARELSDWCSINISGARFSGPLALDTILSSQAAKAKGLFNDPVTGKADAIIVPDIVSGNALFKSLVYLSGGCAAGLVLGAKVPLLLTSRADPPVARVASIALASKAIKVG
tara:strand:- start:73 stop:1011 length:939 start_codon:yes stop_codon:yes gene_type:complete